MKDFVGFAWTSTDKQTHNPFIRYRDNVSVLHDIAHAGTVRALSGGKFAL